MVVPCCVALFAALVAAAPVPAGGEFQVNTYTTDRQSHPSVASGPGGEFVVAWDSRRGPDSGPLFSIRFQRFDSAGAPQGMETAVGTSGDNDERPSVAVDTTGDFMLAWHRANGNAGGRDVFAQLFAAGGSPLGPAFQVNTITTGFQGYTKVVAAGGGFVVAWTSAHGLSEGPSVFARRYSPSGAPLGPDFQVNTYTPYQQYGCSMAADGAGNFVVVWQSHAQDGSLRGIFGQRYDAAGARRGSEFQVNTFTEFHQWAPSVAADAAGNFVVAWTSAPPGMVQQDVFAQRYDSTGARVGGEFRVNTGTTGFEYVPSVVSDAAGNFAVAWATYGAEGESDVAGQLFDSSRALHYGEFQVNTHAPGRQGAPVTAQLPGGGFVVVWTSYGQDGDLSGVFGQRLGLLPATLSTDSTPSSGSDGNRVLEPGESADVRPAWRNETTTSQTVGGTVMEFTGPGAPGVGYHVGDGVADYRTAPAGRVATCGDCYELRVAFGGTRPSLHWDATMTERLVPDALTPTRPWPIHLGDSFADVPRSSPYYRHVETLLHRGVTAGCTSDLYCPGVPTTREQMAALVLLAKEGRGYVAPPCAPPNLFADVPETSIFCDAIEELARRGVAGGCGNGFYCPTVAVTREQMAVFVLRTLDPALVPPSCTTPVFADVPASSPFCRWIEELVRRGIVAGCGGGDYCPTAAVTREQMAVFLTGTFGLTLYGP